MIKLHEDLNV